MIDCYKFESLDAATILYFPIHWNLQLDNELGCTNRIVSFYLFPNWNQFITKMDVCGLSSEDQKDFRGDSKRFRESPGGFREILGGF